MGGVGGASNGAATWEGMGSGPKYSNLAFCLGLGGGREGACEGWVGGGCAFRTLERGWNPGDGGVDIGCLGGGGRVLFLSSDIVVVKRRQ